MSVEAHGDPAVIESRTIASIDASARMHADAYRDSESHPPHRSKTIVAKRMATRAIDARALRAKSAIDVHVLIDRIDGGPRFFLAASGVHGEYREILRIVITKPATKS